MAKGSGPESKYFVCGSKRQNDLIQLVTVVR